MRVLTGVNKSRKLASRVSLGTRPTSARVRKSIFDILWSRSILEGARVLDLFAGTGSLGIEALSRGAESVIFVDHSRPALATVKKNLVSLEISPTRYKVLGLDYQRYLEGLLDEQFDLAFLDPPYAFRTWQELIPSVPASLLVCETDVRLEAPVGFEKIVERKYGGTFVTLISNLA